VRRILPSNEFCAYRTSRGKKRHVLTETVKIAAVIPRADLSRNSCVGPLRIAWPPEKKKSILGPLIEILVFVDAPPGRSENPTPPKNRQLVECARPTPSQNQCWNLSR